MKTRRQPHGGIDWQQVRARLAQAQTALDESLRLSPERARAVMEERALALAQVPRRAPSAAEILEVVTFGLAGERYAVETQYAREVVRFTEPTSVPGSPEFLAGLINLRGEIVAVFDLRQFFGLTDRTPTELSRVIVLGAQRGEFGVLADAVGEVATLRIDEVREAPGSVTGAAREYLHGVTPGALLVLDGAALLRDRRLFINQTDETGLEHPPPYSGEVR
jgi:purine-binding chemotaxis protein CheW